MFYGEEGTRFTLTVCLSVSKVSVFIPNLCFPFQGSFDLFGNLPKPKYCSMKELGRSLVPHILTKQKEPQKKPQQTVSSKAVQKPSSASANVAAVENSKKTVSHGLLTADYVSDDEDDNDGSDVINFFSLCSSNADSRKVAPSHVAITLAPTIDSLSEPENMIPEKPREEMKQVTEEYSGTYVSLADAPLDIQQGQSSDAPLQFCRTAPNNKPVVVTPVGSHNFVHVHADYTDVGPDVTWQTYQSTENEFVQVYILHSPFFICLLTLDASVSSFIGTFSVTVQFHYISLILLLLLSSSLHYNHFLHQLLTVIWIQCS